MSGPCPDPYLNPPPLDFTKPPPWQYRAAVQPDALAIIEHSIGKLCNRCYQPLASHPRCRRCGMLAGRRHIASLHKGLCRTCRLELNARRGLRGVVANVVDRIRGH